MLKKKYYSFAEVDKSLEEHRLIKKINFSIFGFSRGAALARAFTNNMIWKCKYDGSNFTYGEGEYPTEFKFLGIFDTVASFGLPATNLNNHLTFEGRDLVVDERVKMCVHYIAGNELRFAFPVDLIQKESGEIANNEWKELIYPGMHSDVGGGYAPGSQEVNDNYARIPLKDMLDEAVQAGVRLYSYEELKDKAKVVFAEQFEISEDTQKYYDAVKASIQPAEKIQDQIVEHMKVYYSAYGTMDRQGIESVGQRVRRQSKIRKFIPWGPTDMASEMKKLQALQQGSGIYTVLSPASSIYEYLIMMDQWKLDSWNTNTSDDVMKFFLDYVHDSKYSFLMNAEPFSYFRQRTVYESRRSRKGQEINKQLENQKIDNSLKYEINQDQIVDSYEQVISESSVLVA